MWQTRVTAPRSVNFGFLGIYDVQLVSAAAEAERLFAEHPKASLMVLRVFAELLTQRVAASAGVFTQLDEPQASLLGRLQARHVITRDVADLFHAIRRAGNRAAHQLQGDHRTALQLLRSARELGLWYHRAFGAARDVKIGPFVPPPDPRTETQALAAELARLRAELEAAQGAHEAAQQLAEHQANLRAEAESRAAQALADRTHWEELALLTDGEKSALEAQLKTLQEARAATPSTARDFVEEAAKASEKVVAVLDEAQTRVLIDEQLRHAGWEADSEALTYAAGARPEPHKARAIAEWPTENGRADYVLFLGLTAVGVVEAKRKNVDAKGAIEQAKRYSRGLLHAEVPEASPWREYRVPFLFSTNGRAYLRQHKQKSGIHFLDVRLKHNHDDALPDWYTPEGLKELLQQDVARSEEELARESFDYLKLRPYQVDVIRKVERALAGGQRSLLVAMATGTGKTKTAIGMLYRLLKAQRFRRALFLVDRTSLGEQSEDSFREMRVEGLKTFADTYAVKGLKPEPLEGKPKVHITTVQALVQQVLYSDEPPPVDEYDLIVVDECHRGYLLDRDLADDELGFRDEADFISKYRRVLDHFDAVKIGLTATPALHTSEIFGPPVATYSYRQAVIDGFLIDHEPPLRLFTQNSEDGLTWKAGEEMLLLDGETGELETVTLKDEVDLDIDSFNRRVITESFNRVACEWLAQHIDPTLDEKTLVFCVNDAHADMVVSELKRAFDAAYGGVDDDLVKKITGRSDNPGGLIRRYKNERDPNVAVTVDLLTTGVDVPRICNLVFLRRVRSRILYDQMLGRATRLCPEIKKTVFRVYDAVRLYEALAPVSAMKPVVVNPKITFQELIDDIQRAPAPGLRERLLDQLIVKLRAKERHMGDAARERFAELTGLDPRAFVDALRTAGAEAAPARLSQLPTLGRTLDRASGPAQPYILSTHEDAFRRETRGFGVAERPEDYLDAFARFLRENLNQVPALIAVTRRPRDLTRAQLVELRTLLDQNGFRESFLQTAWRSKSNADIAASIIGFIRQAALGEPLVPYAERVDRALRALLASRSWSTPQRKWLSNIAEQLKYQVVLDARSLDEGAFADHGGFKRLDKQFDGKLLELLADLQDQIWPSAS